MLKKSGEKSSVFRVKRQKIVNGHFQQKFVDREALISAFSEANNSQNFENFHKNEAVCEMAVFKSNLDSKS